MRSKRRLLLIELNELNFDVVFKYIESGNNLPNFQRLMRFTSRTTRGEDAYHLLEPWIQWASVHTGLNYDNHKLFRLGDAEFGIEKQIFEAVEEEGFSIGAISPMNAINRLRNPAYFIPDPWTGTPSDNSFLSKAITKALRQTVNDNSEGRVTAASLFRLCVAALFLVRPKSYPRLMGLAIKSFGRAWRRALFLDLLLHEFHQTLVQRWQPNFSTLFLNAGAHIQHHYFLSSVVLEPGPYQNPEWYVRRNDDPFKEMLQCYDVILGEILDHTDTEVLIATGLSQTVVEAPVFYYRLRSHEDFLQELKLSFTRVMPRMTRDFLIEFASIEQADNAQVVLEGILTRDGKRVFGEIDNRGNSLFVVLTYSSEIDDSCEVCINDQWVKFKPFVVFVAIKNGEHTSKGYSFFTDGLLEFAPKEGEHVRALHTTIGRFFGV